MVNIGATFWFIILLLMTLQEHYRSLIK